MKVSHVFPGQASQYVGMGKALINRNSDFQILMDEADEILGYKLSKVMLEGPEEALKETRYTQPAVYLHSIMVYRDHQSNVSTIADALAGHSLGEITALVVAGCLSFEDGMKLVKTRAEAMQIACDRLPGTMAAILGMEDKKVEEICASIDEIVVPANYNSPGQLVISGTREGVQAAIERCVKEGARRAIEIPVGGAFHSPLMEPALDIFESFITSVDFKDARVPVYQNVQAVPVTDAKMIKINLIQQIISPVRWTQSIQNMWDDGIQSFIEVGGKGKILAGMIKKINRESEVAIWSENE